MSKKNIFFVLFILLGITAQSQVLLSLVFGDKLNSEKLEFGLEGGANWSDLTTMGTNKKLINYNLGFYFDVTLNDTWHLDTGVLVKSSLGSNNLTDENLAYLEIDKQDEEGTYSQKIDYFIVPILLKYNFKNRIYLEAGPQVGLMRKSHIEFNFDSNEKEVRIKEYNTDKINRFDAGFTVGTGYKLMNNTGMTLGVKYYRGLVDIYKNKTGAYNNSLFLKLNIPIGANKKTKSE